MKKVIVSGLSGQDGSYMADYLLKMGHKVYGIVRHSASQNDENYRHNLDNPNFEVVSGDITDFSAICNIVKRIQPDYFINFAAMSFVAESWNTPVSTFEIDANGVLHCLEAIRQHKPDCRFYSAGTSEQLSEVEYIPQDENHKRSAKSPYGAAKIAAEQLVRVYRHSYGMYAVHGILFNHESERRNSCFLTRKCSKGVAKIKKQLDNGENVTPLELGFLDSERDWSHCKDFIRGVWMMLNQEEYFDEKLTKRAENIWGKGAMAGAYRSPTFVPEEYVLSSGECHSVREFVEKAFECADIKGCWMGEKEKEEYILIEPVKQDFRGARIPLVKINPKFYRPFEVTKLHGSYEKIKNDLGWEPQISFDELVRLMVENDIKLLDK